MKDRVVLDGRSLSHNEVVRVARDGARVAIAPTVWDPVAAAREVVESAVCSGRPVYGVTTGLGDLCDRYVPPEQVRQLQVNALRSHAAGVGPPLPRDAARALLVAKLNGLCTGYAGVRPAVIEHLAAMLNRDVYPHIPAKGSLGASGDLAPFAHVGLVMIGEGLAYAAGRLGSGAEALAWAGLSPLRVEAKEGLAILNGTQLMSGLGALSVYDAELLLDTADVVAAMTLEALHASLAPFDPRVHGARPFRGQGESAVHVRALTEGSEILRRERPSKVQDAYSIRCIPQVHGACRDVVRQACETVDLELNAATDNPLVFADDEEVLSAGNFHGEPVAFALDFLAIALSELTNIADRRLFRLLSPHLSGLPPFLTEQSGLNSGYMLLQYTTAALVSENKLLASPASVDSIPTSAGQEDHVSMGATAALKVRQVIENTATVLAIEAIAAAQALDFHRPWRPGNGTAMAQELVREVVPHLDGDIALAPQIERVRALVEAGAFAALV